MELNSKYGQVNRKDYKLTVKIIECYKNKACDIVRNKCDRCEAAQKYNDELWCAFDTVNRFINWDNKYNNKLLNDEKSTDKR